MRRIQARLKAERVRQKQKTTGSALASFLGLARAADPDVALDHGPSPVHLAPPYSVAHILSYDSRPSFVTQPTPSLSIVRILHHL